jgi:hypothetical protein
MNMIEKRLARVEELARQLGSDCARSHGARVNIIETCEAGVMVERSGERCPDFGSPQAMEVHLHYEDWVPANSAAELKEPRHGW